MQRLEKRYSKESVRPVSAPTKSKVKIEPKARSELLLRAQARAEHGQTAATLPRDIWGAV